jgi:hypothetical protein
MHPTLATHGAFDDVSVVWTKVCAVNILASISSIAPIMIAIIHDFIVNGAIAPFDVVNPQSNTVALEELTHSSSSIIVDVHAARHSIRQNSR